MSQLKLNEIDTDTDTDPDRETGTDRETFLALTRGPGLAAQEDSIRACLATADTIADAGIGARERDKIVRAIVNDEIGGGESLHLFNSGTDETLGDVSWSSSSSADNADREIDDAVDNDIGHLIVDSFDTLGLSPASIERRIRKAVEGGMDVHVLSQGLDVTEDTADTVLGVLTGLDAAGVELQREACMRDVQEWADGFEQSRGRAPLGFEYRDGELVTAENFDEVRAVLKMVDADDDELPKSRAAERLDASPRTISRAIEEHRDRYGLDEPLGK